MSEIDEKNPYREYKSNELIIRPKPQRRKALPKKKTKGRIILGRTQPSNRMNLAATKSLISEMIQESINRPDMTPAGAHMIESILNPAHQDDTYFSPTRLLDGHPTKTVLCKLSGSCTIAAGTFTSAFLQLVGVAGAGGTQDQSFQVTYGAAAEDNSATMTTVAEYFDSEYNNFKANVGSSTMMRRVSAFIRVIPNSSNDCQGNLVGWNTHRLARTAAATWVQNDVLTNGLPQGAPVFTVKDGITVRSLADKGFDTFKVPNTAIYTGIPNGGLNAWGHMPIVRVSGLSADTVLNVQWGYVMELEALSAFPYVAECPSKEPEYDMLLGIINKQTPCVSGNSFSSFIKSIWRKGKKAYNWGMRNKNEILGLAEGIGRLAA